MMISRTPGFGSMGHLEGCCPIKTLNKGDVVLNRIGDEPVSDLYPKNQEFQIVKKNNDELYAAPVFKIPISNKCIDAKGTFIGNF